MARAHLAQLLAPCQVLPPQRGRRIVAAQDTADRAQNAAQATKKQGVLRHRKLSAGPRRHERLWWQQRTDVVRVCRNELLGSRLEAHLGVADLEQPLFRRLACARRQCVDVDMCGQQATGGSSSL